MAVGCSHGHLIDKTIEAQVLWFRDQWKPDTRVHLGDVMDTAAFRSGAKGTSDESEPIIPDRDAALGFLKAYEATHICWGNHDWRLHKLMSDRSAIVQMCASKLWFELEETARNLRAKTAPYHYRKNILKIGGVHYMHGISFARNAIQIHSNFVGGRVVFAHTHRNGQWSPDGLADRSSFNVGTLADPDKMPYAHERLATGSWGPGVVFGEYTDEESVLWLASSDQGKPLRFPSMMA